MQVSNKEACKFSKFQKMIVYISQITANVDLHSKVHYPNSDLCNMNPQSTVHLKIFLIDTVSLFVIVPQRFHEIAGN